MKKKIQLAKKLYTPTKDEYNFFIKDCIEADCIAQSRFDNSYPCKKCNLSKHFQIFSGMRLEELAKVNGG